MAGEIKLNEAEYLDEYENFLINIRDNDYDIMPTKSNFARWLAVPQKEVIYWYKQHPSCKDVIDQMTADVIIEGMCMKKYQTQAGSMALKNLCKWQDNPEKAVKMVQPTQSNLIDEKEAKQRVAEYSNNFEARRNALKVVGK